MRYVLDRDVALRSWERIPWACYRWGDPIPRRLERDAFELLALCDGEQPARPTAARPAAPRPAPFRKLRRVKPWVFSM